MRRQRPGTPARPVRAVARAGRPGRAAAPRPLREVSLCAHPRTPARPLRSRPAQPEFPRVVPSREARHVGLRHLPRRTRVGREKDGAPANARGQRGSPTLPPNRLPRWGRCSSAGRLGGRRHPTGRASTSAGPSGPFAMRGEGSGRFRRTMRPRARDSQPPATAFVRIAALRSFSRVGRSTPASEPSCIGRRRSP